MYPVTISLAGYFVQDRKYRAESTPLRTTKSYEIELVRTQEAVSTVDGRPYPHRRGNVLIARPGQHRSTKGCFEAYYVHLVCNDETFREKYLAPLPQVLHFDEDANLIALYEDLIASYAEEDENQQLLAYARLMELLSYLNRVCTLYRGGFSAQHSQIDSAIQFMKAHYMEPLPLARIAGEVALTPNYFHNLFKSATGATPLAFLLGIRMAAARRLLLTTCLPLSAVSLACGFENSSYFSQVFRKQHGCSPLQFRKNGAQILD